MKKVLLLLLALVAGSFFVQGQVVIFHEDFELTSLDDSVTSTMVAVPNVKDWGVNSRLHHLPTSLKSDSCQVKASSTTYLTTNTFNTTGNTYVILSFSQICKVDFLDIATIETSVDGITWTQVAGSLYMGTGQYLGNGNRFAANSYGNLWQPSNPGMLPANTWWRVESFDLSTLLGNSANARFRFKLADGGQIGPNSNKGWYLDNVKITMAPSELIPPVITLLNPILTGILWSIGPFNIKAKITDQSGIDTAYVVYSLNNGPNDTVGMVHLGGDTMKGVIPVVADSTQVCWYVYAIDNSAAHNPARNPVLTCNNFTAYAGLTFPYNDNFDINTALWTPSYLSVNNASTWQLGTPSYGQTNSAHSPPNAWDVNLSTSYQQAANCALTSPVFNFTDAVDARLSFWINYNIPQYSGGVKLEYTTDGTTWQTLGAIGDPLAENWYTLWDWSSGSDVWNGSSGGWVKCKYKLSLLNNVIGEVRFRFVFISDTWTTPWDGVSVDDITITLPAPYEAAINSIISPISGCGLGNEPITIDIINTGLTPINGNLMVGFQKSPGSAIITEPANISIPFNDTVSYTFTNTVDMSVGQADSTFVMKAWVTLGNDPNHGDDTTFNAVVSKFLANAPGVANAYIMYGTFATLTANSPYPVDWYDQPTGGNILGSGPTYTTPILYGTTIYYPVGLPINGCPGYRAQDTVFVGSPPPYDGSAVVITSPVTGFNLSATETVRTRIRNYGTQPISNFDICYRINNGPVITEQVTNTLNTGDTMTFTFAATANLVVHGNYDFKSWVTIPGDLNQINDTAYSLVINKLFVYCESTATSPGDDDCGNVTVSNLNNGIAFPLTNNPTSTNMYSDFTGLPAIQLAKGQPYPISITQIDLNGFYNCCAKVFVDWNYNGEFDEATETAFTGGPTTFGGNNIMSGTIMVPQNAHIGYTRFRVVLQETGFTSDVHACGTYTWGETEDYTAVVAPQIPHDASIMSIVAPALTYPQGYTSPVTVVMANIGTDPITSVDISYILDSDPPVTQTWTGNLTSGNSINVSWPAITLPTGQHTICAYTALPGDSNTFNDMLCRNITGVPVDTLPYYDNFDGAVVKFTTTVASGTNWIHGSPNTLVWPDPPHSAPNVWATNLNLGGYIESANCYLSTQIFDFTNAINAKISFWYNTSTDAWNDGTRLEYSLDGGTVWTTLGTLNDPLGINWYNYTLWSSGPVWNGTSAGWKKATYLLSNFNLTATMRFRFVFTSDTWTNGMGMAIDDFAITIPYHQDAGIDSIMLPHGQAVANTLLKPYVRLTNFGMDTLHSVDIQYVANGAAPVIETWTGTLNPGDTTGYHFTNGYLAPQGNYQLMAYTNLPQDGDHVNDTTKKVLFGIPTFIPPYTDPYDSTLTYWYTTGTQWEHGLPSSSLINYSYSPPFAWKTNLDGHYVRTGVPEYLYSPMFDFTLTGYDSLTFYQWMDVNPDEGGRIEYLSSTGWKIIGWMGDPNGVNWYTNNIFGWSANSGVPGWHKSAYDLTTITDFATPTQFRFNFQCIYPNSLYDGWAIDNFRLTSPKIPKDAGVIAINQPSGQSVYGTDLIVDVTIRNFGLDTLYSIPVKYSIDGTTVNFGNWAGTLPPDANTTFTFTPLPSPLFTYKLCAFTDLGQDTHLANDTTCTYITVIPPAYDLQVTKILRPITQTIHGDSAMVRIVVKNVGQNPVSNIPLGYIIADSMIIVTETYNGATPVNPGDSLIYTFNQKYSYEFLGYYYLCAFSGYADDGYRPNDTLCKMIEEYFTAIPENENDPLFLSQNIPNPCDQTTQLKVRLPKAGVVSIEIVNMLGQRVLGYEDKMEPGEHFIDLNTTNLRPGIYYYYMNFDQKRLVRKMIISH
ncbi:MAG: GEVED domain-containing protein [Bacteroidetes bacterium]|nr:GEVED domain-containing protein [Bacteroidota bacterium]